MLLGLPRTDLRVLGDTRLAAWEGRERGEAEESREGYSLPLPTRFPPLARVHQWRVAGAGRPNPKVRRLRPFALSGSAACQSRRRNSVRSLGVPRQCRCLVQPALARVPRLLVDSSSPRSAATAKP